MAGTISRKAPKRGDVRKSPDLRVLNTGRLVSRVLRCFTDELHVRMAAAGLAGIRPAHGVVFEHLGQHGARITDIAARGQVTKQELVRLVNELETAGYVVRTGDPTDARAKLVRLTDKGRVAMNLSEGIILDLEREWEVLLGKGRKREMIAGLEKLVDACADRDIGPD